MLGRLHFENKNKTKQITLKNILQNIKALKSTTESSTFKYETKHIPFEVCRDSRRQDTMILKYGIIL